VTRACADFAPTEPHRRRRPPPRRRAWLQISRIVPHLPQTGALRSGANATFLVVVTDTCPEATCPRVPDPGVPSDKVGGTQFAATYACSQCLGLSLPPAHATTATVR
jgi:hypothetical protein